MVINNHCQNSKKHIPYSSENIFVKEQITCFIF